MHRKFSTDDEHNFIDPLRDLDVTLGLETLEDFADDYEDFFLIDEADYLAAENLSDIVETVQKGLIR